MSWKQRVWRYSHWSTWAQAIFWGLLGMALYAEWVFLPPGSEILDQAPHLLVYRVGFASGLAISVYWWVATINSRVKDLEARIKELERDG